MLERRADRLVALTAAAIFLFLPMQWANNRAARLAAAPSLRASVDAPWWGYFDSSKKPRPRRSLYEHTLLLQSVLLGVGSVMPSIACVVASFSLKQRRWLLVPLVYSFLTTLLNLIWLIHLLWRYKTGGFGLMDGPYFFTIECVLHDLAMPLLAWMVFVTDRANQGTGDSVHESDRAHAFGAKSILITSKMLVAFGVFSCLCSMLLSHRDLIGVMATPKWPVWAWGGFIAMTWGGLAVWLGRKIRRDPRQLRRHLLLLFCSSVIAVVGIYGMELKYSVVTSAVFESRQIFYAGAATAPWIGCACGLCVLVWYWWPVIRGRAGLARRDFGRVCSGCGYDLTGNASGVCPECGMAIAPALAAACDMATVAER